MPKAVSKLKCTPSFIDSEEIEIILDRIDESLTLSNAFTRYKQTPFNTDFLPLDKNNFEKLLIMSSDLRMSSAPLRATIGIGGFRGFFYRILNLPIRLFETQQIAFNKHLRDFIWELVVHCQKMGEKNDLVMDQIRRLSYKVKGLDDKALTIENTWRSQQKEINTLTDKLKAMESKYLQLQEKVETLQRITSRKDNLG